MGKSLPSFDEIKDQLKKNIDAGKLNDGLKVLRDFLKDNRGHEDALFFAAVSLNQGLRRNSPETIDPALLSDMVFDPVFAQCEKCGSTWVPDPLYQFHSVVSVKNPIGGYCKSCGIVVCKKHFATNFLCPDCKGNLEPVKEPNGRMRITLIDDPDEYADDESRLGFKHAIIVGSGFKPTENDVRVLERGGYLRRARMGKVYKSSPWKFNKEAQNLALPIWVNYTCSMNIEMGDHSGEELIYDQRKFFVFRTSEKVQAVDESANLQEIKMPMNELNIFVGKVFKSIELQGQNLPNTPETRAKVVGIMIVKCAICRYEYDDIQKAKMAENELYSCPECGHGNINVKLLV